MGIYILQHTTETPPGAIVDWLRERGHEFQIIRLFANDPLPSPEGVSWLIICGGGMGIHDEAEYPWLKEEKRFIQKVLDRGTVTFGICLGGQLLANAYGAEVKRHVHWEVGWHPMHIDDGTTLTVFQYHQDTFAIPQGAKRIATNAVCANQGFTIEDRVVGLQFHPEATAEWVQDCANERDFPQGPHVQSPAELISGLTHLPRQRAWFSQLMERLEAKRHA